MRHVRYELTRFTIETVAERVPEHMHIDVEVQITSTVDSPTHDVISWHVRRLARNECWQHIDARYNPWRDI